MSDIETFEGKEVVDHLIDVVRDQDVAEITELIGKSGREERTFKAKELRVSRDNGSTKIVGYAAVFEQLSEELWGFREKIAPGAFAKTIQESDIRALFNHDPNFVLGRNKNETLELEEDEIGLLIEVEPPDTQWARDLTTSIERGDVSQMSFGFQTIRDSWVTVEGDSIRTLEEVALFDVSPVTFPAYPQTTVQMRSIMGYDLGEFAEAWALLEAGRASERDKIMLTKFVSHVDKLLTAAPAEGSHPAEDGELETVKRRHAARKRRLELLKMER